MEPCIRIEEVRKVYQTGKDAVERLGFARYLYGAGG